MSFEITGKLIEKYDVNQISESFRKREFVVEKTENRGDMEFIDYVRFQLTQDRCSLLDNFELNDLIRVVFNIRGRKWERDGKINYFTNLEAWRIEKLDDEAQQQEEPPPFAEEDSPPEKDELDDLPF